MNYTPLLTDSEVKAIKERVLKTTAGKWRAGRPRGSVVAEPTLVLVKATGVTQEIVDQYGGVPVAEGMGRDDREFVIHAPRDVFRLLEDRRLLLARLAELEAELEARQGRE